MINYRMKKGLELIIGPDNIKGAIENGKISLVVTGFNDEVHLDMVGASPTKYVRWYSNKLDEGCELTVSVKNITESSVPVDIKEKSDKELLNKYYALKAELDKHK